MGNKRVIVSDLWEVMIPEGFIYCTDKKIIGSHRNIIIMEDKNENEFDESFAATISFTSQEQNANGQGIFLGHQMFNMFSSGDETLVRDNDRMFIAYSYLGRDKEDDSTLDKFLLYVATSSKLSSIQVFFNDSKMSLAKQTALVDKVARSIKPVIKKKYKEKNGLEVLNFTNDKEVTIGNRFILPIPDGFHYSTDPSVIGDQLKLVVFPETYDLSNDPLEAPYGLYVFPMELDTGKNFDVEWCNIINNLLTEQVQLFQNNININKIEARDGLGIFTQSYYGDPDTSWNKTYAAVFAKDKLNAMSIIYNHPGIDGSKEAVYDFFWNVTHDWLERIRLKGEKKKELDIKEVASIELGRAVPDKSLYPHYDHILDTANLGSGLGATVIVNASGTEYHLYSFDDLLKEMEENEKYNDGDEVNSGAKKLIEKCINNNPTGYALDKKAEEMIGLFHVNESIFNMRHDREAELQEGYISKAYMMNALRSFAWTLADYCKENKITPKKIEKTLPTKIVKYVESRKWLNYDGESHCKGLCANSDLHVYYIPDSIPKTESKVFLPSKEEMDDYRAMKEKFPGYSPIFAQVGSLDKLRKDLEYIYPAIQILYDKLAETRDISKPLDGAEADIVYTWIALAKAAKLPFLTEDGPSGYLLSQPTTDKEFSDKYGIPIEPLTTEKKKSSGAKTKKTAKKDEAVKAENTGEGGVSENIAKTYVLMDDYERVEPYKNKSDFTKEHDEYYPKMKKSEIGSLYAEVKSNRKRKAFKEECINFFMDKPVEYRFEHTTKKCFNLSKEEDFRDKREDALLLTKKWFRPEEERQVVKLLDDMLASIKKDLLEQIEVGGENWKRFYSAKPDLEIVISDYDTDSYNIPKENTLFQEVAYFQKALVTVNLSKRGLIGYTAELTNFMPWIWDVSALDIWKAAFKNEIRDRRRVPFGSESTAEVAYDIIVKVVENPQNEAKSFVDKVKDIYDNCTSIEEAQKKIEKVISELNSVAYDFGKIRLRAVRLAKSKNFDFLVDFLEKTEDLNKLEKELPKAITKDIPARQAAKILKRAKDDLNAARQVITRSETSIKEYEKDIEKDKKLLEEKKKELADFEVEKGKELEEDKFRITTNQESQKVVIKKLEASIAELENNIEEAQNELDNTSFFKFSLKKELTAKIEELNEKLKEYKDKLPGENSKLYALSTEYNQKVLKHQAEIESLKKTITDCSNRIKTNTSRILTLEQLIEDKKKAIPALEEKVKELENAK